MILPDDDTKMSKHLGMYIIHCCDIYFYGINYAFVGYNKNKRSLVALSATVSKSYLI